MNKKTKSIIVCALATAIVVSGGLAFSRNDRVSAAPAREDCKGGPHGKINNKTDNGTVTAPKQVGDVVISGGFDTDPQDHGRPVVLIAAALGVPTEVFREAFSGVTPSGLDSQPSSELAERNKAALLKVLAPYGIANDRLDEVSNFYRYNGKQSKTWQMTPATATATITNGVVTGVKITNPGAGYSSPPTITVKGPSGMITATATLSFTKDFKTNGSISSITIK
ncbi:hypothetical protein ACFPPD_21925 [Cohnella suwonensis]|uniref:Uncharacterized protein n=1 Tax=Cohnella suwonensis TaxID=696072 RepID=A0ABW0LZV0_9BACL